MTTALKTHAAAFWKSTKEYSVKGRVFLLVRLYLGAFYIMTGTNKIGKGDFGLGYKESLVSFVTGVVERNKEGAEGAASDLYVSFLETVVLPNPESFTIMVSWGETLLGVALFFGIFVRLAGFMGVFMAMNYLLSSGRGFFLPSFDALLTYTLLTLAMAQAGRTFGIDVFLAKWKPKAWIW